MGKHDVGHVIRNLTKLTCGEYHTRSMICDCMLCAYLVKHVVFIVDSPSFCNALLVNAYRLDGGLYIITTTSLSVSLKQKKLVGQAEAENYCGGISPQIFQLT